MICCYNERSCYLAFWTSVKWYPLSHPPTTSRVPTINHIRGTPWCPAKTWLSWTWLPCTWSQWTRRNNSWASWGVPAPLLIVAMACDCLIWFSQHVLSFSLLKSFSCFFACCLTVWVDRWDSLAWHTLHPRTRWRQPAEGPPVRPKLFSYRSEDSLSPDHRLDYRRLNYRQ